MRVARHHRPLFVAAIFSLLAPSAGASAAQEKALVIGIDGVRPDALQAATTPHLDRLMTEGAYSLAAQTGDITGSGPSWSSLLTGVWREKHGVTDNSFRESRFDRFPHLFQRIKAEHPDAYTLSVVHWAPIHEKIVSDANISLAYDSDKDVADSAAKLLREQDPDVTFIHLDEVDGAGHADGYGLAIPTYRRAIESADALVGVVVNAVQERATYDQEDWLIIVSTDHGGSGNGHGRDIPEHRTIFVIVSGPSAARGEIEPTPTIVDIPRTVMKHLGIDVDPTWEWDGRPVGLK